MLFFLLEVIVKTVGLARELIFVTKFTLQVSVTLQNTLPTENRI